MTSLNDIAEHTLIAASTLEKLARGTTCGIGPIDALGERELTDFVKWEHAPGARPPLIEHAFRAVHNLAGVESFSSDVFLGLEEEARQGLSATISILSSFGLLPLVRLALVLVDFAKGGSADRRMIWEAAGADLTVHNEAAATILSASSELDRLDVEPIKRELLIQMVKNHGLAGQHVRGETPVGAFAPWVDWLRDNAEALSEVIGVTASQSVTLAGNAMHMIDLLDTEAVRPGLVDERVMLGLRDVRDFWISAVIHPEMLEEHEGLRARFRRLRHQALKAGEPTENLDRALDRLGPLESWMDERMRDAQLWYFEPATHRLSSEAAARLLLLGLGQAERSDAVDLAAPFHLSFQPLVSSLGADDNRTAYRVRLIEALLMDMDLSDLQRGETPGTLLAAFLPKIGGSTAVALELHTTDEADALVTLLALYEGRSSVAFHQILKLLCDAYGLRKDEFDRLANEAQYLATMNAARSDKERMLDFARPGTIVEVGPGGGVVLDLLEAQFADSEIIGLDISSAVVSELQRRRELEDRRWQIIEGDAFELSAHVSKADTVIFCSLLHEISSYIEYEGRKFQLEPVRDLLRASFEALNPGGRIIIRDGVKPPPGERVIAFKDPDGPEFLRRFQAEFEGRDIGVEWLDDDRVKMTTADAMEFLYCYTWGPASFPYEVRELYGLMERDEYEQTVLNWLPGATAVEVPDELKSYLQPGYIGGLSPKIQFFDGEGRPAALPDSNALWVFERA